MYEEIEAYSNEGDCLNTLHPFILKYKSLDKVFTIYAS